MLVIVPVFQEVKSEGQRQGQRFGGSDESSKKSEVYHIFLSKMILRLRKEDYVTCLLYYKVKS